MTIEKIKEGKRLFEKVEKIRKQINQLGRLESGNGTPKISLGDGGFVGITLSSDDYGDFYQTVANLTRLHLEAQMRSLQKYIEDL